MDYSTLLQAPEPFPQMDAGMIRSLYSTFQRLADPRKSKGKRYELAVLLTLLVLAKLAGETSLSAATHWIRLRGSWLAERLGLKRASMPCQNTYRSLLALLDAQEVSQLVAAFFTELRRVSVGVQRNRAACSRPRRTPGQSADCHRWQDDSCHDEHGGNRASAQLLRGADGPGAHPMSGAGEAK